jgi:hypothetical protein
VQLCFDVFVPFSHIFFLIFYVCFFDCLQMAKNKQLSLSNWRADLQTKGAGHSGAAGGAGVETRLL